MSLGCASGVTLSLSGFRALCLGVARVSPLNFTDLPATLRVHLLQLFGVKPETGARRTIAMMFQGASCLVMLEIVGLG